MARPWSDEETFKLLLTIATDGFKTQGEQRKVVSLMNIDSPRKYTINSIKAKLARIDASLREIFLPEVPTLRKPRARRRILSSPPRKISFTTNGQIVKPHCKITHSSRYFDTWNRSSSSFSFKSGSRCPLNINEFLNL